MKKLIYGAAIALALGAASCGKSSDNDAKFFSKEATDSLLTTFGTAAGYGLNMQITNAMASDSTLTKEAFLRGLQYGMACDTADAYMNGVITGLQIQTQLKRYSRMGVNVEPSVALNSFKAAFMADSVPSQAELAVIEAQYRKWTDSLNMAEREYKRRLLEESPEAVENVKKGEEYIKSQVANNDSVKMSESGLAYKIINEGTGDKVKLNGRSRVKYTARNLSGDVIDMHSGTSPIVIGSRNKGFKEGVTKLSTGGKAVIYVPGKIGYGVDMPARLKIGPNETLIYEVEVLEANVDDSAPAK